jgi:hypothetical protein
MRQRFGVDDHVRLRQQVGIAPASARDLLVFGDCDAALRMSAVSGAGGSVCAMRPYAMGGDVMRCGSTLPHLRS